jgi:hypothetical protein
MFISSQTVNRTQGAEPWADCATCDSQTIHKIIASVEIEGEEALIFDVIENYQIIQCQGCRTISFMRERYSGLDDYHAGRVVDDLHPRIWKREMFPKRLAGRRSLVTDNAKYLPHEVARIYSETLDALLNAQPVLTGIGIRALIETVCKDQGASGKNLSEKIDGLVSLGVLTQANAHFLHGLRIMGNQAAHEVKPHGDETLKIALEVVEHLLKTVYIIPAKAGSLPKA